MSDTHQNAPEPLVSVIIVSWNRREDLQRAIRSLRCQAGIESLELIIVDNGSDDGTREMLKEGLTAPARVYYADENLGASRARNIGCQLTREGMTHIVFMDSDAELMEPDTLARLIAHMDTDPKIGALGPRIDNPDGDTWFLAGHYLRGGYVDTPRVRSDANEPKYLSTCFAVWRADALQETGLFDTLLPYGFEDNDLSLRTIQCGWKLSVDETVTVRHHISPVSRIRAEADGWKHFLYDERARQRIQQRHKGYFGWLEDELWLWSAEGREFRRNIYYHSGLRRRDRLRLFARTAIERGIWPDRGANLDREQFDGNRIEVL